MKKLRIFLALSNDSKKLLVETFFYLGLARVLKSVSFKRIAPLLGEQMNETEKSDITNKKELRRVSEAIHLASEYTLWESHCLVKAIAAMKMLERRKIPCTLYLGTAKDEFGNLIAHAWLRSGAFYITGYQGMKQFTVVSKFAKSFSEGGKLMKSNFQLNLTTIPNELQLIIQLIKTDDVSKVCLQDSPLIASINWGKFIDLAIHHRVYPILYFKLKALNSNVVPDYIVERFAELYKHNTFQMLHLCGEMDYVAKQFSIQNIPLLLLKGPGLAYELYGDISLRTSSDLDVLIPIDQLENVNSLLSDMGYRQNNYIKTVLNDWKWRHHHVTYFHPQKKIKIEVHWRLNPGPAKEASFEEMWASKRNSFLSNANAFLPGKEDLFVFLISHGARHGWSRLRWLLDIKYMMKQELDWSKVYSRLRSCRQLNIGGQVIVLASEILDVEIPNEMERLVNKRSQKLAQDTMFYFESMVNLHANTVPEKISDFHQRYLFNLKGNKEKMLFLLSLLYPYPDDKETLPLPNRLHFFYFLLRPVLWAWRKSSGHAAR